MLHLFSGIILLAASRAFEAVRTASGSRVAAYEAFRHTHGEFRPHDHLGYVARRALFERRVKEIRLHNAQPGASWTAGLNRFADYSEAEFQALLGHRPSRRSRGGEGPAVAAAAAYGSSFLETRPGQAVVAASMDWRLRLNSTLHAKDQGACGSCWAVAAVGALEAHAEKNGHTEPLSFEQLVDCVENPEECGGKGGCKGATSELAFSFVQKHGVVKESDYSGYMRGGDGTCKTSVQPAISSQGFVRLPENELQSLLEAVATRGPAVVSVDGGSWSLYQAGVFDSCKRDAIVNHAVMLTGYGTDDKLNKDYWLVRNSWGAKWGERGYIRLLRHSTDKGEAGYCGTDNNPSEGVGCKGGPETIPVCGMCGVLSDSSLPTGVHAASQQAA